MQGYHNQYPLRRGAPPQELRSRLKVSQPVYLRAAARLADEGALVDDDGLMRAPDHSVALSEKQQGDVAAYLSALAAEPWSPPTDRPVDPELLAYLQERGDVVKVNETVIFTSAAYADMAARIVAHLQENGQRNRGRRPHHLRHQPQVRPAPAGIPRPPARYPAGWRRAGAAVAYYAEAA